MARSLLHLAAFLAIALGGAVFAILAGLWGGL